MTSLLCHGPPVAQISDRTERRADCLTYMPEIEFVHFVMSDQEKGSPGQRKRFELTAVRVNADFVGDQVVCSTFIGSVVDCHSLETAEVGVLKKLNLCKIEIRIRSFNEKI